MSDIIQQIKEQEGQFDYDPNNPHDVEPIDFVVGPKTIINEPAQMIGAGGEREQMRSVEQFTNHQITGSEPVPSQPKITIEKPKRKLGRPIEPNPKHRTSITLSKEVLLKGKQSAKQLKMSFSTLLQALLESHLIKNGIK